MAVQSQVGVEENSSDRMFSIDSRRFFFTNLLLECEVSNILLTHLLLEREAPNIPLIHLLINEKFLTS